MTRPALAFLMLVGCAGPAALTGCSDPVPRTVTVRADSTAIPALRAVAAELEANTPGLTVTVDTTGEADVVVTSADHLGAAEATALVRSGLVVVGPPGAEPAPTLDAALGAARTVAIAEADASGRLARTALIALGEWEGVEPRLVRVATTQDGLDSVAVRRADLALALASDALASTPYAVVYRLRDDEATPVVFSGTVRAGAPPEAQAFLNALQAPTAYRAWAAAGFRPPPQ